MQRMTPRKQSQEASVASQASTFRESNVHCTPSQQPQMIVCQDEGTSKRGDSSIILPANNITLEKVPFTRDLSDLSGSCVNGTFHVKPSSSATVGTYLSDQSATSYRRPWSQAKILSSQAPVHPQPPKDDDTVVIARHGHTSHTTLIYEDDELIEAIMASVHHDDQTGIILSDIHKRTPIIILLMHPTHKTYELMQLWIDIQVDPVTDIVKSIQQHLSEKLEWKTDYDGLFQIRNDKFTQLIHILDVRKYHPQAYEVFVAKPWSMSGKVSQSYAAELLSFLQSIHILETRQLNETVSEPTAPLGDSVLYLSEKARSRMYASDGILTHHHAHQFLSFSPSFELPARHDILGNRSAVVEEDEKNGDDSSSQLSDSWNGTVINDYRNSCSNSVPALLPNERTLTKESNAVFMGPTLFRVAHPQRLDGPLSQNITSRRTGTAKARNVLRKILQWASCRSCSQTVFAVDGSHKGSHSQRELLYKTPLLQETPCAVKNGEDEKTKLDHSLSASVPPRMMSIPTRVTQWKRL